MTHSKILTTDNVKEMIDKINQSFENTPERGGLVYATNPLDNLAIIDSIKEPNVLAVIGSSGNAVPFDKDGLLVVSANRAKIIQTSINVDGVSYSRVFGTTWSTWKKSEYVNLTQVDSAIKASKLFTASADNISGSAGFVKGNSETKPFIGFSLKDSTTPTDYIWVANGSNKLKIAWAKDAIGTGLTNTKPSADELLTTYRYVGIGTMLSTAASHYYWALNDSVVTDVVGRPNTRVGTTAVIATNSPKEILVSDLGEEKLTLADTATISNLSISPWIQVSNNTLNFIFKGTYAIEIDYRFSVEDVAEIDTGTLQYRVGDVSTDVGFLDDRDLALLSKSHRSAFIYEPTSDSTQLSLYATSTSIETLTATINIDLIKITCIK